MVSDTSNTQNDNATEVFRKNFDGYAKVTFCSNELELAQFVCSACLP